MLRVTRPQLAALAELARGYDHIREPVAVAHVNDAPLLCAYLHDRPTPILVARDGVTTTVTQHVHRLLDDAGVELPAHPDAN